MREPEITRASGAGPGGADPPPRDLLARADSGLPRADRAAEPGAQRVRAGASASRPGASAPQGRRARARGRAPAVPRRAHRAEGPELRARLGVALRLARRLDPLPDRLQDHRVAAARRLRDRRQDGDLGARRDAGDRARHPRAHAQSVGHRAHVRRLERRRRRRGRGRARPDRARLRRRGLGTHSCVALRAVRLQADPRPGRERLRPARPRHPVHVRLAGAHGRGRRGDGRRAVGDERPARLAGGAARPAADPGHDPLAARADRSRDRRGGAPGREAARGARPHARGGARAGGQRRRVPAGLPVAARARAGVPARGGCSP